MQTSPVHLPPQTIARNSPMPIDLTRNNRHRLLQTVEESGQSVKAAEPTVQPVDRIEISAEAERLMR